MQLYRVHTTLGPGLLESVYESVLAYELEHLGLLTTRQQPVPLVYHGWCITTSTLKLDFGQT